MEVLFELMQSLGAAFLHMLTQPFYYIAILLIALYYRWQTMLERKLFHVKLHSWGLETWRRVWTGALAGLLVSAAAVGLGVSVTGAGVYWIWGVMLVLLLIRVRYLCFAYTAGVLGLLQTVVSWLPLRWQEPGGWVGTALSALKALDVPAHLVLAALLHLAEGVLLRWQSARLATPLRLSGKRGKAVGAYRMHGFWPVPLFLLIPAGAGNGALPWETLLGGALGLVPLPVMTGITALTHSELPRRKAAVIFGRLLIYSAVMIGFGLLAARWGGFTFIASLLAVLLHEGLVWYGKLEERRRSPVFVQPPGGLKVLAVLPDSPAAELGILPGETLLKANGTLVRNEKELHEALRQNPAFCKLEIQNASGESKYLQRAIYDGDHHQLGVIFAPDPDRGETVSEKSPSLFAILMLRADVRRTGLGPGNRLARRPDMQSGNEAEV